MHRCLAQPANSQGGLERRRLLVLLSLALAGLLGGCGKKGSLRLPEPPAAGESADEEPR